MSYYATLFKELQPEHDPRHIEAYVRLQYHTLGHLDRETLRRESEIAVECIKLEGVDGAESLAKTFGL